MRNNVGGVERPIRIILGVVLLGVGAFGGLSAMWMALLFVVGTVLLVTGAIGYCPAWWMLGINTCPMKRTRDV
jgi:hypothetical protein